MKKYKLKIKNAKLKTTAEFNELYKEVYKNFIIELEKERKKIWLQFWSITISIILAFFLFKYAFFLEINSFRFQLWYMVFLICAIILPIYVKNAYSNYKKIYKNNVLMGFFKLINNKLVYSPKKWQTQEELYKYYVNANFELQESNECYIEDIIEGSLDDEVCIKMGDMHLRKVREILGRRVYKNVFTGIFVKTSCNKCIETAIKITRDKFKIVDRNDLVNLDNQTFEKYFDIYSEDSNLAYRILTADVMKILMDFYTKYELDFEIVFKENNIYIRFFTGNMFEPKFFGNSMDRNLILFYYTILNFILDLTKNVNHILNDIET